MNKFTCPNCGEHQVVEMTHNVVTSSPVTNISIEGSRFKVECDEIAQQTYTEDMYTSLECEGCGHPLSHDEVIALVEEKDRKNNVDLLEVM